MLRQELCTTIGMQLLTATFFQEKSANSWDERYLYCRRADSMPSGADGFDNSMLFLSEETIKYRATVVKTLSSPRIDVYGGQTLRHHAEPIGPRHRSDHQFRQWRPIGHRRGHVFLLGSFDPRRFGSV